MSNFDHIGNASRVERVLKDTNVIAVPGTSLIIQVLEQPFVDYADYLLYIGSFLPLLQGIEPVSIQTINQLGAIVATYPVTDIAGNVLVSGRLRSAHISKCGKSIIPFKMLLKFGANGLPTAIPHFVVLRGTCPMIFNGAAGAPIVP